jgi:hypothetical protein
MSNAARPAASAASEIPVRKVRLSRLEPVIDTRADGTIYMTCEDKLGAVPRKAYRTSRILGEGNAGSRFHRGARRARRLA